MQGNVVNVAGLCYKPLFVSGVFVLISNFFLQYFTGLECGHKFCMQCWGDYLTTKIIEEGMGQVIFSHCLSFLFILLLIFYLKVVYRLFNPIC